MKHPIVAELWGISPDENKRVYHFGASLKDVGKKWFALSKFDKEAFHLLDKLGLTLRC